MRLGIVGDLSQMNPADLGRALDGALTAVDVVVQLGDINPGYAEILKRSGPRLYCIPGNHDIQGPGNWDAALPGRPKQWRADLDGVTLIGLYNGSDALDGQAWGLLSDYATAPRPPLFLCVHKSPSNIILPDGTTSRHVMGEGAYCPDADKLKAWCASQYVTICCGHFHGQSMMRTSYATILLEGRGGSQGPDGKATCGYTLVNFDGPEWTAHPVSL